MTRKKSLIDMLLVVVVAASLLVLSSPGFAQCPIPAEEFTPDPKFTSSFMLENCTFRTKGVNPYFILQPGYRIVLESDEEKARVTVLDETEVVDTKIEGVGEVTTRVVEEREWEKDGDNLILVEVSRNFFAICKQTNSVFYFGETVVDGEGNPLGGGWRAGENGARPGLIMPGTILLGGRYYQEIAPEDEALDKGRIVKMDNQCEELGELTEQFSLEGCVKIQDTTDCDPDEKDIKIYAKGVGIVQDEDLQVVRFGFVNRDR
jgi:hypothetical protein